LRHYISKTIFTPIYFIKKVLIFLIILLPASMFIMQLTVVRAEDNKTIDEPQFTERGFPKILDDDTWTSQLIYDTIGACYQGTIRWVVLSNPSILGQIPSPIAQRQMVEHCFCVMDMIRKEHKVKEYKKKVIDPEWGGNLFMLKAMECVGKYETLPSFFMKMPTPDNETKKELKKDEGADNSTNSLREESLPDQNKELERTPQEPNTLNF
jgi:hypothetical protein